MQIQLRLQRLAAVDKSVLPRSMWLRDLSLLGAINHVWMSSFYHKDHTGGRKCILSRMRMHPCRTSIRIWCHYPYDLWWIGTRVDWAPACLLSIHERRQYVQFVYWRSRWTSEASMEYDVLQCFNMADVNIATRPWCHCLAFIWFFYRQATVKIGQWSCT